MGTPIVFGMARSVYVRAARMTLEEKGCQYRLAEVDPFQEGGPPAAHLARQPFAKVPAFEHDGFRLYETDAIVRYVDEVFDGPALTPAEPKARARMTQVMRIMDNYAYPSLVWGVFVAEFREPDAAKVASAVPLVRTTLTALADLQDGADYLAGDGLTLADLYAAPMFIYFAVAPTGRELLEEFPTLHDWLGRIKQRPSIAVTRSPLEDG